MSERKDDWVWAVAVVLIAFAIVSVLPMWPWFGYRPWMMGMMRMGRLQWGSMLAIGLVFLILFAIGVYLIEGLKRPKVSEPQHRVETALNVLNDRYAKGEITREQYLQMKADLESSMPQKEDSKTS